MSISGNAKEIADGLRHALKVERIRRRIPQADLAAKVGRSRKWLSDFERGIIDPSFVTVIALALQLDVKIDYSVVEIVDQV